MSIIQSLRKLVFSAPAELHNPDEVAYQQALQWFKSRHQSYDELTDIALPWAKADGVIFDIGANIGYFSNLLAKKLNFSGTLYLFEPIPNLAKHCNTTFENTPYNAHVMNFALSDNNGAFDIFAARDGNIGWNTMVADKAADNMERISIQAKTFDQTAITHEPDFIKIDVEGAEYKVLGGMIPSMKQWKKLPVILCEIGWGKSHPEWDKELAVFSELQTMGYGIFDVAQQPFDIKTLDKTTDILFIPTANGN